MKELFIETSILKEYTPHTCRSAATSKASQYVASHECRLCRNFKTRLLEKCQDIAYYAPEDVDFMSILT